MEIRFPFYRYYSRQRTHSCKIAISSIFISIVLISSTVIFNSNNVSDAQTSDTCTAQPLSIMTSGAEPANPRSNAIDNNLNTRWSTDGVGSWAQIHQGEGKIVCSVDIAWYRGNLRQNNFVIYIWDPNVPTWVKVFSGTSSGTTAGPERYDFPDVNAAYVLIVVNGNTENNFASISEIDMNGYSIPVNSSCTAQPLSIMTSGAEPANPRSNAIDNNLNTRWSTDGVGSWAQIHQGEGKIVCSVDIAWYRGNLRQNNFVIYIWDPNVPTWVKVFSGTSSGTTAGPERYDFPDVNAAYVLIVVNGNTENNSASISEIDMNGYSVSAGDSGSDVFGIKKIYPTKAGGEEWFMDMTDGRDTRSSPPSLTKNSDGSFKVRSTQVRYGVYTTSGYNPGEIETLNHGLIAQNGFMQSPNDWKNVEMTGYVKVNSGQSGENFAWYARGGRHTGDGNPEGCEGSAYKPDLYYDGRVRFAKEQWHVSYVFTDHKRPISSIEDKWVGFKGVMWNTVQNGQTVVKMEIWLDANVDGMQNGPWLRVDENTDAGGWGNSGNECGGASDQIITWGGPIATFRWDGATDVDIKNFSVREIQPPS